MNTPLLAIPAVDVLHFHAPKEKQMVKRKTKTIVKDFDVPYDTLVR